MPILLNRPARLPSIKTLKARNLPVATCANVGIVAKPIDPTNPEHIKAVQEFLAEWEEYLTQFLPPGAECPRCTANLVGPLGSFHSGYGRAHCGICNYPLRVYHETPSGSRLDNVLLAYHPSTFK